MMSCFNLNRLIKPIVSGGRIKILRQYHSTTTKPFSLINPWITKKPSSEKDLIPLPTSHEILGPGMIVLRNYISLNIQVDIVNLCEKWGLGPGGFYIPSDQEGVEQMMCFGQNWDPITKYEKPLTSDGSKPPPLPFELVSLAEAAIQDAQVHLDGLPSMHPDICLVKYYLPYHGRLDLHQDCDESFESLQRGLPVVSMSIGDTALFEYGHTGDKNKLDGVFLRSGDVLIFGGKSRLIYHGVEAVFPCTTPDALKDETLIKPGRLNLTFKQL